MQNMGSMHHIFVQSLQLSPVRIGEDHSTMLCFTELTMLSFTERMVDCVSRFSASWKGGCALQTLVPEAGDRSHNVCRDGVAPGGSPPCVRCDGLAERRLSHTNAACVQTRGACQCWLITSIMLLQMFHSPFPMALKRITSPCCFAVADTLLRDLKDYARLQACLQLRSWRSARAAAGAR